MRHDSISISTFDSPFSTRVSALAQSLTALAWLAFALILCGASRADASTTFSLGGTGVIYTISANGDAVPVGPVVLAGTVTFHVIGAPDTLFPGDTGMGAIGAAWVSSVFNLSWTGATIGSFDSSPVPGADSSQDSAALFDDYSPGGGATPLDRIVQTNDSSHTDALFVIAKAATLDRNTTRTDWLSGLTFPETAGLAPGTVLEAFNTLSVSQQNIAYDPLTDTYAYLPGSFFGGFFLTSMNVVAAVPEPDTFALLVAGILLVGFKARRTVKVRPA